MNRHKPRKCQQSHKKQQPLKYITGLSGCSGESFCDYLYCFRQNNCPLFLGDIQSYKEPIQEKIYFATQYYC